MIPHLPFSLQDPPVWLADEEEEDVGSTHQAIELHPVIRLCMIFLLLWQCVFHVSDAGMAVLVLFMHHLFRLLSSLVSSQYLSSLSNACPTSLYSARKLLGLLDDQFIEYVVCPTCHSIYEYSQCFKQDIQGRRFSKCCWYVRFPNHPIRQYRKECGTLLLESVQTRTGGIILCPRKVFCYRPLHKSIAHLFQKKSFYESCQKWRQRVVPDDLMGDVYDGEVWKSFKGVDQNNFVQNPYNLVLFMNVDWFQPFTHVKYSVGALYLTVQNLPRSERNKVENVILCGIIPGPKEPKKTMNSYLSHLVTELKEFWHGIEIPMPHSIFKRAVVKVALAGVSCDIPAVRKVCGFPGHSATLGCSKCKQRFRSPNASRKVPPNYSEFDRQKWPSRDVQTHKVDAAQYLMAKSEEEQNRFTKLRGVRYSALLEIPYFDPIRFHVIDPMHNLLLGTAKHIMETWTSCNILTTKKFKQIEGRIQSIKIPKDVGRLPLKISSSFSGFTADQWRNWTITFSPVALKGIIPQEHLTCWLLFVKACTHLCTRVIHRSAILSADRFLLQFCKQFKQLYGDKECTPNMHLHLHLKDSIKDYGPVYSFWCFAFERFNGVLGSYHTNNVRIEPQIMRRFFNQQAVQNLGIPIEFSNFKELLPLGNDKGALLNPTMSCTGELVLKLACLSSPQLNTREMDFSSSSIENLVGPCTDKVLPNDIYTELCSIYSQLYPSSQLTFVSRSYVHSKRASIGGELLVASSINERLSTIAAYWPGIGTSITTFDPLLKRIGKIYFLRHSVKLTDTDNRQYKKIHIFCRVLWYQYHTHPEYFGSSAIVCTKNFEVEGPCCFLPLARISNRCAAGEIEIDFPPPLGTDNVFIAIPIPFNFNV